MASGLTGFGGGLLAGTLLTKKAAAAEPPLPPPADLTEALARLDQTMKTLNATLITEHAELIAALSQMAGAITQLYPAAPEQRFIETFAQGEKTLKSKARFTLGSHTGRGGLIWAVVDVSDPDTTISIKVDNLTWEFKISTLLSQGLDKPYFPGCWLTKHDPGPPAHYCAMFSAGTLVGLTYSKQFHMYVTFNGTGTMTLAEGRGVRWEPA